MAIAGIIVGKSFITAMVDGTTHTVNDQHPNYHRIREAVKTKDYDLVAKLVNISDAVKSYVSGKIRVENGRVMNGDSEIHGVVVDRILDMMREGFDSAPMVAFLENLMNNPSKRAVDELYLWLEKTSLPITEDGHFLAYKKVRDDYRDFYTGTMDNSVGKILEMARNAVDDDRDRTCSEGLHFCSLSYLPQYHGGQGRVMIVKVNPADVVSIPSDYDNAKGRTCRYEVIGEHTSETTEAFDKPVHTDKRFADRPDDVKEEISPADWEIAEVRQAGFDAGLAARTYGTQYDDFSDYAYAALNEAYEEGYADGWDQAATITHRTTFRTTPVKVAPKALKPGKVAPGLVGYNDGRRDAAANKRYDDAGYGVGADAKAYQAGYAKGWDSIKLG